MVRGIDDVWMGRELVEEGRRKRERERIAAEFGMAVSCIQDKVLCELKRAQGKFPQWPSDPVHAAAIVAEECGELQRAVLQHMYEPHKGTRDDVRTEAIQTAAMCLRFLIGLDRYKWLPCEHHEQSGKAVAE